MINSLVIMTCLLCALVRESGEQRKSEVAACSAHQIQTCGLIRKEVGML